MNSARTLCFLAVALPICCAALRASAAAPRETHAASTPECGLAVLQADSVVPVKGSTGRVSYEMKYRVVAVIEQPPEGRPIEAGATVQRPVVRGTGRFVAPSPPRDFVSLERVHWRDGAIVSDMLARISIPIRDPTKDPARVAEYESKAFRSDVLKVRSARTSSAQAAAAASVAASTRTPSASLIMEAHRIRLKRDLSYEGHARLSEGVLSLAVRADVPQYLREAALGELRSATGYLYGDAEKLRQWSLHEAGSLLEAFHDWVTDPSRDLVYAEILLGALQSRLDGPSIRSAAELANRFARFPKDLAEYERRLEKAGDRVRLERIRELGPRLLKMLPEGAPEKPD